MTRTNRGTVFDGTIIGLSYLLIEYKHCSNQTVIYNSNLSMSTFKKEKAPLKPTRKARNELTEEQKQEIKEAFDLFDTDGVGTSINMQDTSMPRN